MLPVEAAAVPHSLTATVVHDGAQQDAPVERDVDVSVGDMLELHFRALAPQHPTYVISGLPAAAQATSAPDGIDVIWSPGEEDAGTHEVVIQVTDGAAKAERKVRIAVEHVRHLVFAPGLASMVFVPNAASSLGAFVGGGVEILLWAFTQRGHRLWPSHGRVYFDVQVLAPTRAGTEPMVDGAFGFDISLERTPRRRYLLPFAGAEVGVAFQKDKGTFGWGTPLAGLYVWASPRARVSVRGGYALPTTGDQDVRGVRLGASIDWAWW